MGSSSPNKGKDNKYLSNHHLDVQWGKLLRFRQVFENLVLSFCSLRVS